MKFIPASVCLLILAGLLFARFAAADLAAPNARGVAMGHLHFTVRDVDENLKFWKRLGGTAARLGDLQLVSFPDVIVALTPGEFSGNSAGAVVNHVAFRVRSLQDVEQAGLELEYFEGYPGVATVFTPDGERIELFDEQATNLGFAVDNGRIDDVADRHNRPLPVDIASHHIHLNVPEADVVAAKQWYVEHFGAVAGKRWHNEAADLPGINLNFSAAAGPVAPMHGRLLDHIGFEVENLEQFCRQLTARGIRFDVPYSTLPTGVGSAFLTDPWGTYIELTEGLAEPR